MGFRVSHTGACNIVRKRAFGVKTREMTRLHKLRARIYTLCLIIIYEFFELTLERERGLAARHTRES